VFLVIKDGSRPEKVIMFDKVGVGEFGGDFD
jgi:hypothetical protein